MAAIFDYKQGVAKASPIALAYLSVSFSFGIMAAQLGFPWWASLLISMVNLTSAGQVAGVLIIAAGGGFMELMLSQLVINMRYVLMSIALSQKIDSKMTTRQRAAMSFGITDEIFALCVNKKGDVNFPFFIGVLTLPYFGWAIGTLLGALAGAVLPELLLSVLGIAIYGMFVAIVFPVAKKQKNVAFVCLISMIFSTLFTVLPSLAGISSGISILICTIAASLAGTFLFPLHKAFPSKADSEDTDRSIPAKKEKHLSK